MLSGTTTSGHSIDLFLGASIEHNIFISNIIEAFKRFQLTWQCDCHPSDREPAFNSAGSTAGIDNVFI